jgi:DNA-binding CsgD family transcriptional regulator
MPSYVRTRLLQAREFVIGEMDRLRATHPAYDCQIAEDFRSLVGFDYYFFSGVDLDNCRTGTNIVLLSNMPEDGVRDYYDEKLVEVDPLMGLVSPERNVLSWHDVPDEVLARPEVKRLIRLLDRHHIPPRTIISLWNADGECYGGAGFAREAPFSAVELRLLEWYGTRMHMALSEPVLTGFNLQIGLTPSEKACLMLASRGYISEEIAQDASLSPETVNTYLKIVVRKLGARNRTHAVADAIRLGLID